MCYHAKLRGPRSALLPSSPSASPLRAASCVLTHSLLLHLAARAAPATSTTPPSRSRKAYPLICPASNHYPSGQTERLRFDHNTIHIYRRRSTWCRDISGYLPNNAIVVELGSKPPTICWYTSAHNRTSRICFVFAIGPPAPVVPPRPDLISRCPGAAFQLHPRETFLVLPPASLRTFRSSRRKAGEVCYPGYVPYSTNPWYPLDAWSISGRPPSRIGSWVCLTHLVALDILVILANSPCSSVSYQSPPGPRTGARVRTHAVLWATFDHCLPSRPRRPPVPDPPTSRCQLTMPPR